MVCSSPAGFKFPAGVELPVDIPLEIGFSSSDEIPWTKSDNKFRYYKHPTIRSIVPDWTYVDDQVLVTITADAAYDTFFPSITGKTDAGDLDMMHAIVVKFGEFGVVPAKFVSKTVISTISPDTKLTRDDINEETVSLGIALNG
jgi:hypothetical protein